MENLTANEDLERAKNEAARLNGWIDRLQRDLAEATARAERLERERDELQGAHDVWEGRAERPLLGHGSHEPPAAPPQPGTSYVVTAHGGQGAALERRLDADPAVASWVYESGPPEVEPTLSYAELLAHANALQAQIDVLQEAIVPGWRQGFETPHPAYDEPSAPPHGGPDADLAKALEAAGYDPESTPADAVEDDDEFDDLGKWRAWAWLHVGRHRRCSDLRDALDKRLAAALSAPQGEPEPTWRTVCDVPECGLSATRWCENESPHGLPRIVSLCTGHWNPAAAAPQGEAAAPLQGGRDGDPWTLFLWHDIEGAAPRHALRRGSALRASGRADAGRTVSSILDALRAEGATEVRVVLRDPATHTAPQGPERYITGEELERCHEAAEALREAAVSYAAALDVDDEQAAAVDKRLLDAAQAWVAAQPAEGPEPGERPLAETSPLTPAAFVAAARGVLDRAAPDGDKAVMLRWLVEDAAPAPHGGAEPLADPAAPPSDWRHAKPYPLEMPPPGCSWVRCWKSATGPQQRPGWRWEATDVPISDLVAQLNRSIADEPPLVPTAGSCAGHRPGEVPHVLLDDGRVLVVLPSQDALDEYAAFTLPKGANKGGPSHG